MRRGLPPGFADVLLGAITTNAEKRLQDQEDDEADARRGLGGSRDAARTVRPAGKIADVVGGHQELPQTLLKKVEQNKLDIRVLKRPRQY